MKRSFLTHGRFPVKLFLIMLALRLVDLILIQSIYVPDEYWQSMEVSHRQVFKYGHLTWEWTKGIRSYFYVSLISGLYYVLKFANLDTPDLVVLAPRLFQAVLSSVADVYFVRWVNEKRSGQYSWAFLSWLTSHFINYCSTRTLINTFEMNITTIALYYYPWSPKSTNFVFIGLVSLLCFVRPTSTVIWLPLVVINIVSSKTPVKYFAFHYLPVVTVLSGLLTLLDSFMHGSIIVSPWNFFTFNVFNDVGSHYGTHPLLWYFYTGIPAILGLHFIPFSISLFKTVSGLYRMKKRIFYDVDSQMLVTILWSLSVFSFIRHKEFRFLMPLLPMMLYMSSGVLSKWSSNAKTFFLYTVGAIFIITNYSTVLFLGQFHKVGGLQTMKYLSEIGQNTSNTKFLFLTPCHSLPLYSHLHRDIPTDFLTCLPNFDNITDYKDEADIFYENPRQFLRNKYAKSSLCSLPTHIIAYNSLNITNFLHLNNFTLIEQKFDSYMFPDRTGQFINIYKRRGEACIV